MKKKLAVILAVVMLLSMSVMPLAAANTANQPGQVVVDGDGNVVYVNREVFRVVLPTMDNFSYTLDPLGLVGWAMDNPGSTTTSLSDLEPFVGGLIFRNATPTALNQSAVPIAFGVQHQVIGVTEVVADEGGFTSASPSSVVPHQVFVTFESGTTTVSSLAASPASFATVASMSASASSLIYELDNAVWQVALIGDDVHDSSSWAFRFDESVNNNANGVQFQVTGGVNPDSSDWGSFVRDDMGVRLTFAFMRFDAAVHSSNVSHGAAALNRINANQELGFGSAVAATFRQGAIDGPVFTNFPSPTTAQYILFVEGIPANANITAARVGTLDLVRGPGPTPGTHFNSVDNDHRMFFAAGRYWPGAGAVAGQTTMEIFFTVDGSEQVAVVSGLTFGG